MSIFVINICFLVINNHGNRVDIVRSFHTDKHKKVMKMDMLLQIVLEEFTSLKVIRISFKFIELAFLLLKIVKYER